MTTMSEAFAKAGITKDTVKKTKFRYPMLFTERNVSATLLIHSEGGMADGIKFIRSRSLNTVSSSSGDYDAARAEVESKLQAWKDENIEGNGQLIWFQIYDLDD